MSEFTVVISSPSLYGSTNFPTGFEIQTTISRFTDQEFINFGPKTLLLQFYLTISGGDESGDILRIDCFTITEMNFDDLIT